MDGHDDLELVPNTAASVAQIARMSPEAAGLVAKFMEGSGAQRERILETVLAGPERERDEWKERALYAEGRVAWAKRRLMGLFDYPGDEGEAA
jgi:hypothetical protein